MLYANSLLYIYFNAPGDGYIDDLQLVAGSVPEAGPNLIPNGDFESALTGPWTVSPNHASSAITTEVKRSGNSSLHIVASVGGTTQASAIWQTISPALVVGQTYTLSYWHRQGATPAPLTVRFSGNGSMRPTLPLPAATVSSDAFLWMAPRFIRKRCSSAASIIR